MKSYLSLLILTLIISFSLERTGTHLRRRKNNSLEQTKPNETWGPKVPDEYDCSCLEGNECSMALERYVASAKKSKGLHINREEFNRLVGFMVQSLDPGYSKPEKLEKVIQSAWDIFHLNSDKNLFDYTEWDAMMCFFVDEKGFKVKDFYKYKD